MITLTSKFIVRHHLKIAHEAASPELLFCSQPLCIQTFWDMLSVGVEENPVLWAAVSSALWSRSFSTVGGCKRAESHFPHPHFPIWCCDSSLFFSLLLKPLGYSHLVQQRGQLDLLKANISWTAWSLFGGKLIEKWGSSCISPVSDTVPPAAKELACSCNFFNSDDFNVRLCLSLILHVFALSFGLRCFHTNPLWFLCLAAQVCVSLFFLSLL